MITDNYVSFETATLLKEKGFDEPCNRVYMHDGKCVCAPNFMEGESFVVNDDIDAVKRYDEPNWIVYIQGEYAYLCPSISLATKWLREEHKIHIQIWILEENGYWFNIEKILNTQYKHKSLYSTGLEDLYFDTYEEACEAAIKYCLEHLI